MSEEKFCYIHQNTPTRLSCSSCGRSICTKCMINAEVGYKCKECAQKNISHIEKITGKEFLVAGISGFITSTVAGLIWHYLSAYGLFASLGIAYLVGYMVSRSMSRIIGHKIGRRIQILAGMTTIIGMFYNPVLLIMNPISSAIVLTVYYFSNIYAILAGVIAVWAAVRHFKF